MHYPSIGGIHVKNALPRSMCEKIIEAASQAQLRTEHTAKNLHSSMQLYDSSPGLTTHLATVLRSAIPSELPENDFHGHATFDSLNRRLRLYKYEVRVSPRAPRGISVTPPPIFP